MRRNALCAAAQLCATQVVCAAAASRLWIRAASILPAVTRDDGDGIAQREVGGVVLARQILPAVPSLAQSREILMRSASRMGWLCPLCTSRVRVALDGRDALLRGERAVRLRVDAREFAHEARVALALFEHLFCRLSELWMQALAKGAPRHVVEDQDAARAIVHDAREVLGCEVEDGFGDVSLLLQLDAASRGEEQAEGEEDDEGWQHAHINPITTSIPQQERDRKSSSHRPAGTKPLRQESLRGAFSYLW